MESQIAVARDFTRYPGPRYRSTGPFSGEEFRDRILTPALRTAIANGGSVVVVLDNVAGYGSSFLEESFGGLIRVGFNKSDLDKHLVIVAQTPRFHHHAVRARQYIAEAADRAELAH